MIKINNNHILKIGTSIFCRVEQCQKKLAVNDFKCGEDILSLMKAL